MSKFPYPGLRPFRHNESDIFFGRDDFVKVLVEKLNNHHFIAVVGNSGCGKSSLIHAGLLANLRLVRVGGRDHWRVAIMRPGSQPFLNMAKALLSKKYLETEGEEVALWEEYLQKYQVEEEKSIEHLNSILTRDLKTSYKKLENILPSNHNLLIVVDQFEELFRNDMNEVENFVEWLLATANDESKTYVVITMRTEFLDECAKYYHLADKINGDGFVLLPHLNQKQLKETIEFPAKMYDGEVAPELVERLLNDLKKMDSKHQSEHQSDQLPLLQYALMRMWTIKPNAEKVLTVAHYRDIGGNLAEALTQMADDTYEGSTDDEKKAIEILFRRLSQQKDGIYTRHPVKLKEIAELANVPPSFLLTVIAKFRQPQCNFLFAQNKLQNEEWEENDTIDIRHESIIRQWEMLKQWTDKEAELSNFYEEWRKKANLSEKEEGNLWRDLDLRKAEKQVEEIRRLYPSKGQMKSWASRYEKEKHEEKHFDFVWKFLEDSQKEERNITWRIRGAVGLVATLVMVATVWGWWGWDRADQEKQRSTENLFDSHLRHASLSAQSENYTLAQEILQKTYELDSKVAEVPRHARNFLASFIKISQGKPQSEFRAEAKTMLFAIALSSDDKIVAAVGGTDNIGTVELFDADKGTLLKSLVGHQATVRAVVFHPNNEWIATAGEDKRILLWSIGGQLLKELPTDDKVRALAISPYGGLASAGNDKVITLWNVESGKKLKSLPAKHTDTITSLAFNKKGDKFASGSSDKTVCLWDLDIETGQSKLKHQLKAHEKSVQEVAFNPEGDKLATASEDRTVRLWNVDNGKKEEIFESVAVFRGHKNTVFSVIFSNDGRHLISGGADNTLRILDIEKGVTVRVLEGHTGFVTGIALEKKTIEKPNENQEIKTSRYRLFTSSTDHTIKQWDTISPHQRLIDLANTPTATAIAPNGDKVAIGFENGSLQLHDLPTRKLREAKLTAYAKDDSQSRDIQRLAFSPDGKLLASASLDKTAKLWKIEDNQLTLIKTIDHQAGVNTVAFLPEGKTLFTASYDGQMGVFNIDTQDLKFHPLYEKDMNSISWNATGDTMLTTSDNQALLWKNNNWQQPAATYPMQQGVTGWAALSPDAQQVALVGDYFTVKIHPSGQPAYDLPGHKSTVFRAIFSPDSQQLATVSGDNTVKFWDLLQRSELFTINLPTNGKNAVWDFDFRCMSDKSTCWVAVPLSHSKQLALYELSQ